MPVTVSVVVPNYNYGRYLETRLRTILDQSWRDLEVIVVDDGSTDESREVIGRFAGEARVRVRAFDENAGSTYRRWNDGAAMATGEYLWFAGADDESAPSFVETLVQVLDRHPRVSYAYSRSAVIDEAGQPRALSPSPPRWNRDFIGTAASEVPLWLAQRTIPTASAVLLRRSAFQRWGGFDTSLSLAADHLLWLQLLRDGDVAYVAQPLTRFRSHPQTVRSATPRHRVIEERYRVFGFLLREFDVAASARAALCQRLARNWSDCLLEDRWPGLTVHRAILAAAREMDPAAASRMLRLAAERRLGIRIRGPLAVARYGLRRSRDAAARVRGVRVLRHYSRHYRVARQAYEAAHPPAGAPHPSVHGFGLIALRPGDRCPPLALPDGLPAAVRRLACAADRALSESARCRFVPRLRATPMAARSEDVAEILSREVLTIQLRDPFSLDGLRDACEPILDALERQIYGSYVIADKVYVYRSPISEQVPTASWLWHYDNHPREVLKVLIYLTDVGPGQAPFEYLHHPARNGPIFGAPLAPIYFVSRVAPEAVDRLVADGAVSTQITGPRGTVIVFDDNIVHRGTLARAGHRDVLVLQVRPAVTRVEPRIDRRWTGTFLDRDINPDPFDLEPRRQAGVA